jgi:hypothetical protein
MLPHIPDEGREREIPRILQLTHQAEAEIRAGIAAVIERRFPVHSSEIRRD